MGHGPPTKRARGSPQPPQGPPPNQEPPHWPPQGPPTGVPLPMFAPPPQRGAINLGDLNSGTTDMGMFANALDSMALAFQSA